MIIKTNNKHGRCGSMEGSSYKKALAWDTLSAILRNGER